MNKIIISFVLFMTLALSAKAGDLWVIGMGSNARDARGIGWDELDVSIGIAYYQDASFYMVEGDNTRYEAHNRSLALYAQIPLVKYNSCRISFGVIAPENTSRIRPEFSTSVLLGEMLELPHSDIMPIEIGLCYAMSNYEGWAIQMGLLRVKW